jgi:hypothetical protein
VTSHFYILSYLSLPVSLPLSFSHISVSIHYLSLFMSICLSASLHVICRSPFGGQIRTHFACDFLFLKTKYKTRLSLGTDCACIYQVYAESGAKIARTDLAIMMICLTPEEAADCETIVRDEASITKAALASRCAKCTQKRRRLTQHVTSRHQPYTHVPSRPSFSRLLPSPMGVCLLLATLTLCLLALAEANRHFDGGGRALADEARPSLSFASSRRDGGAPRFKSASVTPTPHASSSTSVEKTRSLVPHRNNSVPEGE